MTWDTWAECLDCEVNCCKRKIVSYPLFLTDEENEKFSEINKKFPCRFLNENGLCDSHDKRPLDCRLFPLDIIREEGEFYWAYWNINCPIIQNDSIKCEIRLQEIEDKMILNYKVMKAYSGFKLYEFLENFGMYVILRKIVIKKII